ncbi:MAG: flavodoxin family protein [Clostridiaceae bacterium]
MKVLIINGSPRKGSTWELVKLVKESMLKQGQVEFEEVMLSELNLPSCKGCFNCFLYGEEKCPHSKIITPIVEKLISSDCLIITSPVYALNVSGLLKNFLDHTAYFFHRPYFFDKKALVISSTAGAGAKKVASYIEDILKFWGFNKVYKLSVICQSLQYKVSDKVKEKCYTLGKVFYDDVASGKTYSPSLKRIMYYNLWRTLSLNWEDENAADRKYWRETGLIKYPYSTKVKVGAVKKGIGNGIHSIFKILLKVK